MKMRLALQRRWCVAIGMVVLPMSLATQLSMSAFAVPLENAHDYVYGRTGLALTEAGKLRLLAYDKYGSPIFVHGPTMITMDYIALQHNGHEPESGSTDPADQKKYAKAKRRLTQTASLVADQTGGDDGGGSAGDGGGPNDGGLPGGPGGGGGVDGGGKTPVSAVPLPASLPLFMTAFAGLAVMARRRKHKITG
jgi:hypothetical protein